MAPAPARPGCRLAPGRRRRASHFDALRLEQAQREHRLADHDRERLASARAAAQQLHRLARHEAELAEPTQRHRVDLRRGRDDARDGRAGAVGELVQRAWCGGLMSAQRQGAPAMHMRMRLSLIWPRWPPKQAAWTVGRRSGDNGHRPRRRLARARDRRAEPRVQPAERRPDRLRARSSRAGSRSAPAPRRARTAPVRCRAGCAQRCAWLKCQPCGMGPRRARRA